MPILRDSLQKMLERRNMVIVETLQFPPERSLSLQYRRSVVWSARVAVVLLADPFYGDIAVHLIRHKS